MKINASFDAPVTLHAHEMSWVDSPMAGVQRKRFDRVGEEVARATSMVRYAPESHFSAHTHDGGEEFLVLEGVFQDEHGDYPAGSYVRNPPQSRHTPGSKEGCTIFVKLWQFDPSQSEGVHVDMNKAAMTPLTVHSGGHEAVLYADDFEQVVVQRWDAQARATIEMPGGVEVLVLKGELMINDHNLMQHSWCRLPEGSACRLVAGGSGAMLWIKRHHLAHVAAQIARLP